MSDALGSVYSTIDSYKRRLVDALRNPGAALEQSVGHANDRARVLNEMTSAAAQGPIGGPADKALAMKLAESYNPAGITVWHGSPHRFTKFDASKIGTGEGAQAYGHGIYAAESPDVAKQYKETLAHKAYAKIEQQGRNNYRVTAPDGSILADGVLLGSAHKAKDAFDAKAGNLYKIDLPDEHVARMLDWDKPLKDQPKEAKQFLSEVAFNPPREDQMIGEWLKPRMNEGMSEYWSDDLRKAGIPGIRYLDQSSRGQGKGTSNFVVFPGNEDMLTIQEVNGQPIIDALRNKK